MLRFPPDPQNPSKPDFCAKPIFALLVYTGGNDVYEPFDELYMDDEEWEQCVFPFVPLSFSYYSHFADERALLSGFYSVCRLKASGEQVEDRIVEVYWETSHERWRMMRFRDDKPNGNYKTVVENIIQSIIDGVEKEDVRKPALSSILNYILSASFLM